MFRQNKINKFIKKYGWELFENNFDELEIFLNNVNGISSFIRKIEKLSKRDQEYVVSSINGIRKYGFNEEELELILKTKIKYIKENSKENFKRINFDHIYYAFRPNKEFFTYYIKGYQYSKNDSTSVNLAGYYDTINKYYKQFNKVFKKVIESENYEKLNRYIYSLPPRFLSLFFEYTKEHKIPINTQTAFFNYLAQHDRIFNLSSARDFNDMIEFVFKCEDDTHQQDIVEKKLNIVNHFRSDLENNWCYLNAIGNLTDRYILGIFNDKNILYDANFLNLLKESDNHTKSVITDFIRNMDSNYNDYYYKILNSDTFSKLSYSTVEFILKEIESMKDVEPDILMEKVNIIMSWAVLDDTDIIKKTLDFVEEDSDIKLLSTKINCIKNIIPYVYSGKVSRDYYGRYLELLNEGLEDKSIEDKIDILETKADFFEKECAYSNVDKISKVAIKLLNEEDNRNKDVYTFISNTSSNYDNVIVEKIVEGLSNLKRNKDKESFIDFVVDEFFVESNKNRQELLLELFDSKKVVVDFAENVEKSIEVSPYVYNVVSNNDEPLEFTNKDTGLKIFVKTNQKRLDKSSKI